MIDLLSWTALSKRLLISCSARDSLSLTMTTNCFGRLFPIRVIADPDQEPGNGSWVKNVEEQDHWPPVDLLFTRIDAGQMSLLSTPVLVAL